MSERVAQSYDDNKNRAAGKSSHQNQSVWMAHWSQTSVRSSSELEKAPDVCTSLGQSGEASGARSFKIFEKGMTSSTDLRKHDLQSFPMFNLSRSGESSMGTQSDIKLQRPLVGLQKATEPAGFNRFLGMSLLPPDPVIAETSTRGAVRPPQGTQWSFERSSKSHCFPMSESLTTLHSLQDDFMGSAAALSTGISLEKSPVQSLIHRREKFNQLNTPLAFKDHLGNGSMKIVEHETHNYQNHSGVIQCAKVASHPQHRAAGTPSFGEKGMALLLQHPSSSDYQLLDLFGEKNQQVQKDTAVRLFPGQSCPVVVSDAERLYHEYYSLQTAPYSVHDVETMRFHTTVEDIHKGEPRYSQMTRHVLITERMDANISDDGQILRGAMLSTKFKRKAFGELLSLSPPSEIHGRQRLKLQLLESSDSERKEKGEDGKGSEEISVDKSSTKTDSMDMECFQTNRHLCDLALSPSSKDIEDGSKHVTGAKLASASAQVERRMPITELPDINEEPPALQDLETSMNDAEQSTSRTQSLDVEHLISLADHPSSSKTPALCLADNLGSDPSSRWVKRLKLSSSDSDGHDTKSLKMEVASSHEKMNEHFRKILAAPITSPDTRLGMSGGNGTLELRESPQFDMVTKNVGKISSMNSMKEYQNITPSHFWIRRWCHSRAASLQKKPDAVVTCEPHSPKEALDDFQKKQFPSIAAMALMGKALYGFPPCEFRKRGPLMVWNTNSL